MIVHFFDYTDSKGKESTRQLRVTNKPSTLYAGTDLSELGHEDLAAYAIRYDELHEAFINALTKLDNEFDLNHKFRQFKPESMTNVTTEEI